MKIKGSRKKFWFLIVTACLVVALVASGVMVLRTPSIQNMMKNSAAQTDLILTENQGEDVHRVERSRLQPVGEDGLAQLLFDPVTLAPVIYIPSEQQYWYGMLPEGGAQQAVFTMEVASGGKRYLLNSQDNSVAMGNASAQIHEGENKVTATYVVAQKQADADVEKARVAALLQGNKDEAAAAKDRLAFTVKITYELKDGSLVAQVDCSQLQNTESAKALSLSLLPDFGSSLDAVSDGFLLVPDGSGAVIDLSRKVDTFDPLTLKTYGTDVTPASAQAKATAGQGAVLPAYGIRQKNCAFLALVEQGDAWSSIHADRVSGASKGENQAYASFALTANSRTLVKGKGQEPDYFMDFAADKPHGEPLSVRYRFLTRSNAEVSGMAVSCREQLMRNGTLSTDSVAQEDYLPFFLTVLGQADVLTKAAGITRTDTQVLTTYEQAYDLVEQMRLKGINAMNLRYVGALGQGGSATAGLSTKLGSRKSLASLGDYMKNEKLNLYLDANLITKEKSLTAKAGTALGLDGRPLTVSEKGVLRGQYGAAADERYVKRLDDLPDTVETLLTHSKQWPIAGYCVGDAGRLLPVDFSESGKPLRTVKETLAAQNAPLSVNHRLMVDTGNIYMLRRADSVINMPLNSSRTQSDGSYKSVPFLQMVVHGLLDYAGPSINLNADPRTAMLRAVEYGACPSFTWTYADTKQLSKDNTTYYGDWLVTAADYYIKANAALKELRGARMTGHTMVAQNVYRTQYDNSASIYVNYTDAEVKVDGIVIPAMDFIKV